MAESADRTESARSLFSAVRGEFASLKSHLADNPVPQIDLKLAFDAQPELVFPVVATLHGDELCLSVGESFYCEWFPCSDPGVVEQFRSSLVGVLSGSVRLVEFAQRGQVFKARLEECSSGYWRPAATWSKSRWPSLGKPSIRVQRNRPSRLRNGAELDRALAADLRDDAGVPQVADDARAAIHREARNGDLPWLRTLLEDDSARVREAVAKPIAGLEGLPALRDLLVAYQRGRDENLDQPSFAAVLIGMVSGDSGEVKRHLQMLAADSDQRARVGAQWLIEHCDANASK